MIDLEAYFARIGYDGPRTPSLATLRALHALHPAAIPFENIDPFLNRGVSLESAALQEKLVRSARGGYCFEQNALFKEALTALGFHVAGLAGRVLWSVAEGGPPNPRAHMILKVDLPEGAYVADVGFGGFLFSAPLRLTCETTQETLEGDLRFCRSDLLHVLQAKGESGWRDVYAFTLEPQLPIDHEVANWYVSTHPKSRFRNNLLIERLTPQVRVSLFNSRLTRRAPRAEARVSTIASAAELEQALARDFGLTTADAGALFARLPQA